MAGGGAEQQQKMRDFVSRLFQGSPDLSILTHAIIRKKYLDHVGLQNLSKQEKEQLKQLVEEELIQMKVDQPPSNVELRTEAQDSINHKRPLHISHKVSSDEKDSGIDSKKRQCHGSPNLIRFSDSSDQQDSRAGNHSTESENDEETTRSKRKPSLQEARWERGRDRKSPKGQGVVGSQKRRENESEEATTDTGQSDLEEEVKERRKVTKGISLKQRDFKKKVDKVSKDNDPKGKAKNRIMNKQRDEKNLSEGGPDLSEVEEISEKKREWSESENEEKKSFSTNKAQQRMGPGTQKDLEGNESEDTSGSGPDEKFNLQKKMVSRQCRRKNRVVEDSGSSSEDSANQSPGRKEGAKRSMGERGSQQTGNHSKPKRQPKDRGGRKKMQQKDLRRKKSEEVKKMAQRIQDSTSEESESKSGEHKSLEEKKKWVQVPTRGEGESQSEMNQGQSRKVAVISLLSENESDESEDGDPGRTLEKKSKDVSGSDSSQGEEELKKRGAQKSQRKSIGQEISVLSSEDLGRTPSLAKCKAVKQKREEAAEVASLDISNIIATEGRPKRRKVWSLYNKPQESSSSPEELTVRRHTTDWSQLRGVISSDGESS
ncbi:HIRA-interacting protein 3 [Ophiophagus hannah]|uniref:HIRA-interacting protein 3 n=1 Tax=Ophiophagus hannah TaxID=8665 RepID=V8NPP6_OPHHA|nr:HIRA-interacting protein 3 [Ophiophagus hannah]